MSNITDPYYLLQMEQEKTKLEQEKTKKLKLKLNYRKFLIKSLMKLNIDLLNDTDEEEDEEDIEEDEDNEDEEDEEANTEDKVDTEDELNLDDFAKKLGIIKKSDLTNLNKNSCTLNKPLLSNGSINPALRPIATQFLTHVRL